MKSEGSQEFIRIRDQFIGEIEKYNCDEIGLNKYENHEFKKRPGVNFEIVKSKGEATWWVCEDRPVLSLANVQGVIERSGTTIFQKIRVAWRICLKPLVVLLRSNAARAIQNLRNLN